MIFHVVRYACQPTASADERAEVVDQLRRLATLAGVNEVVVGPDLGPAADGFEQVVMVTFSDVEAYERYQRDATHAEIIAYIVPRWSKFASVDFVDAPEPGLRDRMARAVAAATWS